MYLLLFTVYRHGYVQDTHFLNMNIYFVSQTQTHENNQAL